jgi:type II secretory pathway predicted ATPase ExeA
MIEASSRLHGVEELIDREQYFLIHAARQSGKTTYLRDLAERLNAGGKYYTLYCSLENMQGITASKEAIPEIVKTVKIELGFSNIPIKNNFAKEADYEDYTNVLRTELTLFCMSLDKPLVILFDEADCLSEDGLITFLRQLRNGYNNRSSIPFVHSIVLVGMRNIRDYKAQVRPDSQSLGSASPFNIVTKSMTLKNFTKEEISCLYRQHTDETGQIFGEDAIELVWQQTQGQPWLVNAIANEVIVEMLQWDYTKPVTAEMVEKAIQTIIIRRDTHIDSLLERLKEERVRNVIESIILGEYIDTYTDDFYYVRDLGLIRVTEEKIEPANPVYGEVIIRTLNNKLQDNLQRNNPAYQIPRYLKDGRIDMDFLMSDFQQFWRENSAIWIERFYYKEAAPHLILMAFLQRVINGGGQIIRELAAEKGHLDLCLVYEGQKYPIELKIWHGKKSKEKGITQTLRYMNVYGCTEGWLAIFDRSQTTEWDSKIYMEKKMIDGKIVTIVGL